MLDQHLADHEHVSGARLSLADIALATPLTAIGPAKLPVEGRTNVLRARLVAAGLARRDSIARRLPRDAGRSRYERVGCAP